MKTFKAIGAALVLALSLSIPAFADGTTNPGDVHTPGRSTSVPDDPTPEPAKMDSTVAATQTINDTGFLNIADILWALASIY